jgi:1,4-dihydroxy-2-naphthoate octaprenyltransferase
MKKIRFWLWNARWVALPQSILPALVAICLACTSPNFSWVMAILAVFGVAFGHLGINLLDDFFDYKKDNQAVRDRLNSTGIRARIAKCHYITSGEVSVRQLFWVASSLCIIALLLGIIIFFERGKIILIISAITAFLGLCYSGRPFRFSYHGLGELVIGLVFGPLLMMGIYFAACGDPSMKEKQLIFISIPIGLLVTNIVYTHSVIDFEADKAMEKKTLAVILKQKNRMNAVSFIILFSPFAIILAGIILAILPVGYLFTFIALFHAIYLFKLILDFQKGEKTTISPRRWMGPMERWEGIKTAGIDWFMIRWYMARNLLMLFSLLIIIISLILTFFK